MTPISNDTKITKLYKNYKNFTHTPPFKKTKLITKTNEKRQNEQNHVPQHHIHQEDIYEDQDMIMVTIQHLSHSSPTHNYRILYKIQLSTRTLLLSTSSTAL